MGDFVGNLPRYWKTVIVVTGVVLAVGPDVIQGLTDGFSDNTWSMNDTYRLVVLVVTSYGVYRKTNRPPKGEPASPEVSEADA